MSVFWDSFNNFDFIVGNFKIDDFVWIDFMYLNKVVIVDYNEFFYFCMVLVFIFGNIWFGYIYCNLIMIGCFDKFSKIVVFVDVYF